MHFLFALVKSDSSSNVKLKAQLPFVRKSRCQSVYREKQFSDEQFCAGGEDGVDSCRGDSGGPLMLSTFQSYEKWTIFGIVSHGPSRCGTKNMPGIYTNVSSYVSWIHQTISSV